MELFANLYRQDLFADINESVVVMALALVRMLGFVHYAPVFSHKSIPSHARIALAIFLTTMVAGRAIEEPDPQDGYSLIYVIIANFILGFMMGFTSKILFSIVTAGGEMMDAAMGFSSGQSFDPSLGSQTTIIGKFFGMLSVVVFFSVNGPERLLEGLTNSFDTFSIYLPTMEVNVYRIIHLCGDIIKMGFIIVSPVVLTILINDLVLGLISRASPQINAFQISFTIKPSIGAIIWLLIMPLFFAGVENLFLSSTRFF